MSLYRRQGLTSRASIIFTTSQIPLSDYASFSSTIGNPGWFLQTHLNRQTVWFIQYLNPFLSLFFDPILEPFALFSLTKTVFFFVFLLFSFRVLFSSPGRGIVFLHFFNSYRSRVKEKKKRAFRDFGRGRLQSLPLQTICFPVVSHINEPLTCYTRAITSLAPIYRPQNFSGDFQPRGN